MYMTGVYTNVSAVVSARPPMMVSASGRWSCAPPPNPIASGMVTAPPSWIPPPEFNVTPKFATGVNTPAGVHGDLMQVLLGDGSVRRVTSSMSAITWVYAVSPADGRPMPEDW